MFQLLGYQRKRNEIEFQAKIQEIAKNHNLDNKKEVDDEVSDMPCLDFLAFHVEFVHYTAKRVRFKEE